MATIATYFRLREPCRAAIGDASAASWVRIEGDMTPQSAVVCATARLRNARERCENLVIDASNVSDADTKFVAVLVDIRRRTRAAGAQLTIIPSAALRRWLRICRMECVIE